MEEFSRSPKPLVTTEQLAPGSVRLSHFSPELFTEFRQIGLHSHTGTRSRKVRTVDLDGAYGKDGFIMYSNDGTKRYRITIDNTGTLISTLI
mgnify:CR=1 FL=1